MEVAWEVGAASFFEALSSFGGNELEREDEATGTGAVGATGTTGVAAGTITVFFGSSGKGFGAAGGGASTVSEGGGGAKIDVSSPSASASKRICERRVSLYAPLCDRE